MASSFSTCDLCDEHKAIVNQQFFVLSGQYQLFGGKTAFSGKILTVKCYEDNTSVKAQVESPGLGRVLVVDGGGSLKRSLLGGNLASAAAHNGWAGLVIHGAVRDVDELKNTPIGIAALGRIPLPTVRQQAGLVGITLNLDGVILDPNDHLWADADGIVILKQS